jgi:glycosyltransferase involved in cell wall biosynthesis
MGDSPGRDTRPTNGRPDPITLSIVIPAFNAALTLPRTLDSLACIAASDRPRVQVIVVNDGSTDETSEIIGDFVHRLSGFIWTPLRQPNRGVAAARNLGLGAVSGEWILFLDADDELVASPLAELAASGGKSCLFFPVRFCRQGTAQWVSRRQPPTANRVADVLSAGNPYPICSLVFRADCLDKSFDESLRYLEDWKFWWDNPRVFACCRRGFDSPLVIVHIHGANRTSHFSLTAAYRERIAVLILEQAGHCLSRKQRNNLRLHIGIAKAMTGRAGILHAIPPIRCSWTLYLKLLLFLVLGSKTRYLDPYG